MESEVESKIVNPTKTEDESVKSKPKCTQPEPRVFPEEIDKWWKSIGEPKLVVAPMVDASELPWRFLSRRYGAQLCFTPMFHSRIFSEDAKYRNDNFFNSIDLADRPLIVQFCGNDPKIIAKAAEFVQDHCDAIDINLGCPQTIAKKGHYGAFLQDEWELVSNIVKEVRKTVKIPVTCKIRVFEDVEKTIAYAKMIVDSGAFMLTVHGRTIDQKGPLTGLANWAKIKAVRDAVNIPMLANGNIQYLKDALRCIEETGVDGVMTAEGNLQNPALFQGINPPVWQMALEYIDLANEFPCPLSYARGHLFKLFHHLMVIDENNDLREQLARGGSLQEFKEMSLKLQERFEPYYRGEKVLGECTIISKTETQKLHLPPWLCQPYERPSAVLVAEKYNNCTKPPVRLDPNMSNKMMKKLIRNPNFKGGKQNKDRVTFDLCRLCKNIRGVKCDFELCKKCCKNHCHKDNFDCNGHRIFIKTNRLKAQGQDQNQNSNSSSGGNDANITSILVG